MMKFWWRSISRIQIHIATLVRHVLAEVHTVPVLLVFNVLFVARRLSQDLCSLISCEILNEVFLYVSLEFVN